MKATQKNIARFHYLTQDTNDSSHEQLSEIACENGVKWIQLRVKDKPYNEIMRIATKVKSICDQHEVILIINDHVEIAKLIGASGVHLGKEDTSIIEARKFLGDDYIIGGTANNLEDIRMLEKSGADYIGLGPFRFTNTKKNLSTLIGKEGYHDIMQHSISVPVIAIGGILNSDVDAILTTGVHGIAVSSAINLAEDKPAAIRQFLQQL